MRAIHSTAEPSLHYSVQLYDGSYSILPRHEIYNLPPDKYQSDVEYLWSREKAWLGQSVIARMDSDGLYYPAKVEDLAEGTCHYQIRWANGGTQEQAAIHIFGPLTKRRVLRVHDYVIALTQTSEFCNTPPLDCVGISTQPIIHYTITLHARSHYYNS